METFGQRFQRLRKEKNLTQEDIASKINITPQSISKWENDLSAPDISILPELAKILEVSLDELLTGKKTDTKVLEDYDYNKALLKILVNSAEGDEVTVNFPVALGVTLAKALTASNINGDNDAKDLLKTIDFDQVFELIKKGIIGEIVNVKSAEGDVVIVRQQDDAESGDIVIAMINGDDATCKRLRKYRDGIELIASNPNYKPMFFSNEDIATKPVKIIGKVVELRAKF